MTVNVNVKDVYTIKGDVMMSTTFFEGYALLIGVGDCAYSRWSLPVTIKDVQAIKSILVDPNLCAYPDDEDHIRLLYSATATRDNILAGLNWLHEKTKASSLATAVVYFSGHGWLEKMTDQYYLIPHDVEPHDLTGSALPAKDFIEDLRAISAQRLLVFIDSCHAQGMATSKKEAIKLPRDVALSAFPKSLVDEIKQGAGRAVFTSSRGEQLSWIRPDNEMSIFTYHLLEALQGAGNRPGDNIVKVSNLMNYLGQSVPKSADQYYHTEQTPFFDTAAEDFVIALLRGGKGLSEGWDLIKNEAAENIRRLAKETNTKVQQKVSGRAISAQSNNQSGGITVGFIQGNVAGENMQVNANPPRNLAFDTMLDLLEAIKEEVNRLDMPLKEKNKAQRRIDDAIDEMKSEHPDKESVGESLANVADILEKATTIVIQSTTLGKLLVQALEWTRRVLGWL